MSIQGMKKWLKGSDVQSQIFEENAEGDLVLKEEYANLREQCIRLYDAGKPQNVISAEYCRGSDYKVLVLVMTLVEDVGLTPLQIDAHIRQFYGHYVRAYLLHSGEGGRALPPRKEVVPLSTRRRELAEARS